MVCVYILLMPWYQLVLVRCDQHMNTLCAASSLSATWVNITSERQGCTGQAAHFPQQAFKIIACNPELWLSAHWPAPPQGSAAGVTSLSICTVWGSYATFGGEVGWSGGVSLWVA